MTLSTPKVTTFWFAVALLIIGILASLVTIPALTPYALWIVVLAFVLLAAGVLVDGL